MGLYKDMAELETDKRRFVVCTVVAVKGSTPQKPGARMLVLDDNSTRGTIGGGAIEKEVTQKALALLRAGSSQPEMFECHLTHELAMCCGGSMTLFLEPHAKPPTLFIFGAGHVSQALAPAAMAADFETIIVDARAELLSASAFAASSRVEKNTVDFARKTPFGANDYVCIMTHDHAIDFDCLSAIAHRNLKLAYLGVIGSDRKRERFRSKLKAEFSTNEKEIEFECPMGIEIAALTPREIAVSIVARLVQIRRAGQHRQLL